MIAARAATPNHFNCLHSFYMLLIVCTYNFRYVHGYVKRSSRWLLSFFGPSKCIVGLTLITAHHWLPPPSRRDRHQIKYCVWNQKQCKIRGKSKVTKNPRETLSHAHNGGVRFVFDFENGAVEKVKIRRRIQKLCAFHTRLCCCRKPLSRPTLPTTS